MAQPSPWCSWASSCFSPSSSRGLPIAGCNTHDGAAINFGLGDHPPHPADRGCARDAAAVRLDDLDGVEAAVGSIFKRAAPYPPPIRTVGQSTRVVRQGEPL